MVSFRFDAIDTWFFRESRPMEAVGGAELRSVFPPSPRTLLGAVRTAIGDASGVDWERFKNDSGHPLRKSIGFGDDLGPLELSGPWLHVEGERLYPMPFFLLAKGKGQDTDFTRLRIGPAVETHMGRVKLPELAEGEQGCKPLERAWITGTGLAAVLSGQLPVHKHIYYAEDLFQEEPRLGIARDNVLGRIEDGLLYQTCHLRPRSNLSIEADITLAEGTEPPTGLVRLGGEGRPAYLSVAGAPPFPQAPALTSDTKGLLLVLMTPARFGSGEDAWLPDGFTAAEENGVRIWKGKIAGVDLVVHAAVLGKTSREGGWDMANHRPRDVQSMIPAGSAYYVTIDGGDINSAVNSLHNIRIGKNQELGRGHLACGLWKNH